MILQDMHVHTCFSDGKHTPEEVAESAYKMGVLKLGFSEHGFTPFDNRYCMPEEKEALYRQTIAELKEKYKGKMEILCGIEQDLRAGKPKHGYDYVIGSVHYQQADDKWYDVDGTLEEIKEMVSTHFDNDIYIYCEKYFENVSKVVEETGADIIGHFDLLTKFNEQEPLIDETHPMYRAAWKKAVDYLLQFNKPFEINTGAISRGYRTTPYPNPEILKYILDNGGKIMLNSDSHSKDTLCYKFDLAEEIVKKLGYSL
ncbi:MAG: histidinol-phosphatase HisJ family protein [Clostridia bacterium]|nr:histidinol-phosphatase HisJ family protein [Clostridia bacterium]